MTPAPTKKNKSLHGPQRTCIGCRRTRADHELVRLCLDGESLRIGTRGIGRGAWICPAADCIRQSGQANAFSRAFRSKLADAAFADTLLGWLGEPKT